MFKAKPTGEIKVKNVYFIQANDIYGNDIKTTYFPYAVGCIQAYCMQDKDITDNYNFCKFLYVKEKIDAALCKIKNPFIVLFSCSVWNMEYNKALAQQIKLLYPKCYIVFGGHNISSDDKDLQKYDYVDFLVHRFGEEPTAELLKALHFGSDLAQVDNISFRNSSGQIITTKYKSQTDNDYPSPYLNGVFDEIMKDNIRFSGLFETNRGCPNSCSFCDWSSLKDKVRLFPVERVFKELDWFAHNKIEYIYCTDGNFCLFDRDAEIADYVVTCKEKYGYPKIFKAFFTKNRFNFVFDVSTKFFKSGLDKAKTISFQSMNDDVLKNIGRKNISTEMFKDLMNKYNQYDIPTFSELILGLPGETYDSFCQGVNLLIENGQHYAINIYPCEVLPNAEMGSREYQKKYDIRVTRVPFKLIHSNANENNEIIEYSDYVTSTFSMNEIDWVRGLVFSSYVQGLHNLGLLRAVAMYCRHEYGVSYDSFYNQLIAFSADRKDSLLGKVFYEINRLCCGITRGENELVSTFEDTGNIFWGFDELIFLNFYKELNDFYKEIKQFFVETFHVDNHETESLFKYQFEIIKKIGIEHPSIANDYDFYSYFNSIFAGKHEPLQKNAIKHSLTDKYPVNTFEDFAREVVWYGRNRRVSDYTSGAYEFNS